MKKILLLLALLAPILAYTQTYNSTTTGGAWNLGTSWVGGTAPADNCGCTANVNGNISAVSSITGISVINVNNGKNFYRGNTTTSLNLALTNVGSVNIVNGNMYVYGNLTLDNTDIVLTSGNLYVQGTLTIKNGSSITVNGGTFSAANITTGGSGGDITMNGGSLTVSGTMTVNSGSTVTVGSSATASIATLTTSNNTTSVFTNDGTTTVSGTLTFGGVISNSSTGTLTVGTLTGNGSGGSKLTNDGDLNVTGSVGIQSSSLIQLDPGSQTLIYGNFAVTSGSGGSSPVLTVGTNAAAPPYADLAIKGNVALSSGGDIEIQKNGRYATFGNMSVSGGGEFQIDAGGNAYVDGNLTSAATTVNNNSSVLGIDYGLYVNGTASGAGMTSKYEDPTVMTTTNPTFALWVATMSGLLPVELTYFKIKSADEHQITVGWETTMEKNLSHFILEKSMDGVDFHTLTTLDGKGGYTAQQYTFTDSELYHGRNYYRLKTVDIDGTEETFNIVMAESTAERKFQLFPNPVKENKFNFSLNYSPDADAKFEVFDNKGLLMRTGSIDQIDTQISLDPQLAPGIYYFTYRGADNARVIKFVVE